MKVAIYVRSSQDLNNVSCDSQEEQIRKEVENAGDTVYCVFRDQALSSTRDVRPAFDEMISVAMSRDRAFEKICCLDTSRFGRDHYESRMLIHQLRQKYGVQVSFVNMPETGTFMDEAMESIMSVFDYLHSQQSKAKGVASMKQNVRQGYRAGGRAPYGYKNVSFSVGRHRKGNEVMKTKLEPDPNTAPFAKEYLERRAAGESRMVIFRDFFERGISSPSGREAWPITSGKSIEDNIETYLGHTVFNRLNERVKVRGKLDGYKGGMKYKPREEWVITENTHEPLISKAVADQIIRMKEKKIRQTPITQKRIYPLSGVMKCSECGTNYIGDRVIYRCNATTKAGNQCCNEGISGALAEDAVFSFVHEQLLNSGNVKSVIYKARAKLNHKDDDTSELEVRLKKIENEVDKFVDLYRDGILDKDDLRRRTTTLKEQKYAIEARVKMAAASNSVYQISREEIQTIIDNLQKEVKSSDPMIRKRLVQQLFDQIVVFPKKEENPEKRKLEIRGISLPLTRVYMASPTGFEPVLPA